MKKLTLLLFAAAWAVFGAAPSHAMVSAGKTPRSATKHRAPPVLSDRSLYQLDSTWTNDFGQGAKFGQLHGRVQVVALFFIRCTFACPTIVQDMKRIEAALPKSARAKTGFTLVTLDPVRDTTGALHAYRSGRKLAPKGWTILRGTPDDTLELAALLGVKIKHEASGQIAHSNLITVLNQQGEIIHQQAGLNQDVESTVRAIENAQLTVPAPRSN